MKKALLATLVGAALAADASAAVFDFSYVDGIYSYYGSQKKEVYDVAIFLPGETFEGMKIVSVNCPINAQRGISKYADPTVWLASELKLEDKKNAPDLASYEAIIVEGEEAGTASIQFEFPEAFEVPAAGVYVGYSFETTAMDGGTKYPIGIGMGGGPNSFFLHSSKSSTSWTNVGETQGYSSAMSLVVEATNLLNENVSFISLPDPIYLTIGEEKSVVVTLTSTALNPVNSVDFEFTIGGTTATSHYDLETPVTAGIDRNFIAKVAFPAQSAKLSEQVEVKIAKVNGVANESGNASASTTISTFDIAPEHQTLFEEFTGTWCGWCTRGFAALEHIAKNYPDFVVAAYHNGDAMQVTSKYPVSVGGFPSASLNRNGTCDPYYGNEKFASKLPIVDEIKELNAEDCKWGLKLSHNWDYDNILTAKVDFTNIDGFEEGAYKVGYLLVCDGLSNASWSQSNSYSSYAQSSSNIPELNNFCSGGIYGKSKVKGLVFNDVVISIDGYKGVAESVPSAMVAEEIGSHSHSWDLNSIAPELLPDKNKLRIIAFILDSKGKPVNAAKHDVTDFVATGNQGVLPGTGVESVLDSDENAPVEFYNLNGQKVANPSNGIFIRRQGASSEKVVIK